MHAVKSSGIWRSALWTIAALVLFGLVCLAWSLVEARLLFVDRHTLTSPQLPAEFDGTRVVFASDLHAGDLLGEGRLNRVIDTMLAERPDLILLGGDYIGGGEGGPQMFWPAAKRLRAPLGTIAVLGNHEGGYGAARARAELEKAGVLVLGNEHARVERGGATIVVAGVEDKETGRPKVRESASDVAPNGFGILVSHNPDVLPPGLNEAPKAFDLALAGHTHGGQITLFGLYAPYMPSDYGQRFRGGWSIVDGVPTLVSRGAGVFILPMRFFAPPQVHVITLRKGPVPAKGPGGVRSG